MSLIDTLKKIAPDEVKLSVDSSGPHAEAIWKKTKSNRKPKTSGFRLRKLIYSTSKEQQLIRLLQHERKRRFRPVKRTIRVGGKDYALERLNA